MLKIDELKVSYGGIEAVKGISFEVPEGAIVTLIGANGAGKSTTLRTIAGLVKPAVRAAFTCRRRTSPACPRTRSSPRASLWCRRAGMCSPI